MFGLKNTEKALLTTQIEKLEQEKKIFELRLEYKKDEVIELSKIVESRNGDLSKYHTNKNEKNVALIEKEIAEKELERVTLLLAKSTKVIETLREEIEELQDSIRTLREEKVEEISLIKQEASQHKTENTVLKTANKVLSEQIAKTASVYNENTELKVKVANLKYLEELNSKKDYELSKKDQEIDRLMKIITDFKTTEPTIVKPEIVQPSVIQPTVLSTKK